MSIWNPFAFTPTGQAVAPMAPPALRVMDGQATAQQLAHAQDAFYRFCASARLSAVPNPTEIGALPDGTRYRIVKVGPQTTMEIWPAGGEEADRGGGIVVFYVGVGFRRIWWRGGVWNSKAITRGFCGANLQRGADGTYFCDSVATTLTTDSSTFLEGLVRSRPYPLTDGVSTTPKGYLVEYMEKGDINFAIAQPTGLVYLSAVGTAYKVASINKVPPAGEPTKLTGASVTGELSAEVSGGSIVPAYARRTQTEFLLASLSNEWADTWVTAPGAVVKLRSIVALGVENIAPGLVGHPHKKEVNIFAVGAAPPHNVSRSRIPIISEVSHKTLLEGRRTPTKNTRVGNHVSHLRVDAGTDPHIIYAGFPKEFDFVTHVAYDTEDGYTRKAALDRQETQWLRECVSYGGERYSAQLRVSANIAQTDEYKNERFGNTAGTGHAVGSWQVYGLSLPPDSLSDLPGAVEMYGGAADYPANEWGQATTTTKKITNRISSVFTAGHGGIKLLDADITLEISDGYRSKRFPQVGEDISRDDRMTGELTLCKIVGYEEKSFIAVTSEDKYTDFAAVRPDHNSTSFSVTATKTSSICVYFRGRKVWSVPKGASPFSYTYYFYGVGVPVPTERLPDTEFTVDNRFPVVYTTRHAGPWVDTGSGTGYYDPPQIITAGFAEVASPVPQRAVASRYGGLYKDVDTDALGEQLWLFDYQAMHYQLAEAVVRFAVDPTSGGCAVICSGMNILISPTGSVSQLAETTKLPDNQLDPWCASL